MLKLLPNPVSKGVMEHLLSLDTDLGRGPPSVLLGVEALVRPDKESLEMEVPLQKQDGPFADVITYLDDLAQHVPTWKAWDELVFPAPLTEPSAAHKSNHFSYILGCTVDLGGALHPLRFCMTEPSGKFVGVACGLLFEGNVLAYDPTSNGMKWIPVWRSVNDLSPIADSSAWELSNITLPDSPEDIPQMDPFGELCRVPASVPLQWCPVPELPLMMKMR